MVVERSCSVTQDRGMVSGVRGVIASSSGRVNVTSFGRGVPVIAGIAMVRTVGAFSAALKMQPDHTAFMDRAIVLAREAIEAGDGPAGCVIVAQGEVVGEGRNRVRTSHDPTAHAELLAVRAAAARLGRPDLSGLTLYATMEPCPMCCGALFSAKISTLVLGARHAQFRTTELGAYSVEALAAMTGRTLEIVTGIREVECRDLRYEALQRSVRDAKTGAPHAAPRSSDKTLRSRLRRFFG